MARCFHVWGMGHCREHSFIFRLATKFIDVPYPGGELGMFGMIFGKMLSCLGNGTLPGTFFHLSIGDKID
ncbi:hypothetical protein [Microseira wollei]|uniref:hypothetical protein n=1 Tax=Microseira wollei TaxID=467598 RepID=UPI001CFEEACD|nr:hypothetical protein [Microseira wollei]